MILGNVFLKIFLTGNLFASPIIKTSTQLIEINEGLATKEIQVWLYEDEKGLKQNHNLSIKIDSSNKAMIPLLSITTMDFLGNKKYPSQEFSFNDGEMASSLIPLKMNIQPVYGLNGDSDITITVSNGEKESSQKIKVKVTSCLAISEGWGSISTIGLYPLINWQPSTIIGPGCGIKGYNVYRSLDIDDLTSVSKLSELSPINENILMGNQLQFIDYHLDQTARGKVFYYLVLPVDNSGRLVWIFGRNADYLPIAISI